MKQDIVEIMSGLSIPNVAEQRKAITDMETALKTMDQVEIPANHLVHGGTYTRWVTVPAGTTLTGDIYKFDHVEIMISGTLVVTTDDGQARVLEGFNVMPALTGKKRAAHAIEDTTWLTVHSVGPTDGMTPDQIQGTITCPTFEELEKFYNDVNRADYAALLESQNWHEDDVRAVVQDESDYSDALDLKTFGVSLGDSKIQGTGLFAEQHIVKGELIMPARLGKIRTQAGRFINHALRPNACFILNGDTMLCVATADISPLEEITVNYRETLQMRNKEGDL